MSHIDRAHVIRSTAARRASPSLPDSRRSPHERPEVTESRRRGWACSSGEVDPRARLGGDVAHRRTSRCRLDRLRVPRRCRSRPERDRCLWSSPVPVVIRGRLWASGIGPGTTRTACRSLVSPEISLLIATPKKGDHMKHRAMRKRAVFRRCLGSVSRGRGACGGDDDEGASDTEAPTPTEAPTATEAPTVTDGPTATDAPTATEAPDGTDAPAGDTPCLVSGDAASGEPIKVGSIQGKTGPDDFSSSGQGAKAFFECVNANGGINGRPVRVSPRG